MLPAPTRRDGNLSAVDGHADLHALDQGLVTDCVRLARLVVETQGQEQVAWRAIDPVPVRRLRNEVAILRPNEDAANGRKLAKRRRASGEEGKSAEYEHPPYLYPHDSLLVSDREHRITR